MVICGTNMKVEIYMYIFTSLNLLQLKTETHFAVQDSRSDIMSVFVFNISVLSKIIK